MKRLLISFLLTFAAVFSAKAICVQRNYRETPPRPRIFHLSSSSQINHGDNRAASSYFLETNDSSQMFRTPVRRVVSFIKGPSVFSDKFNNYFQKLTLLFPHASTGFVSSCKLMLYPFHVFW